MDVKALKRRGIAEGYMPPLYAESGPAKCSLLLLLLLPLLLLTQHHTWRTGKAMKLPTEIKNSKKLH